MGSSWAAMHERRRQQDQSKRFFKGDHRLMRGLARDRTISEPCN